MAEYGGKQRNQLGKILGRGKSYAQDSDMRLALDQKQYRSPEAWHVSQQMMNRVRSPTRIDGMLAKKNVGLKYEVKVMKQRVWLLSNVDCANT